MKKTHLGSKFEDFLESEGILEECRASAIKFKIAHDREKIIIERTNSMPMKNPPHSGRSIRNACLEPLGLSVTDGAKLLGVTRQALNNVISGKSGISPEMAIRLTKAFGSTPETWLKMQLAYDLAQAGKNEHRIKIRRYRAEPVHAVR